MNTAELDWAPSPSPTVWRKRLHNVGPEESGQVTSLVRYDPGSRFPAHDHPEGEEFLVLEGVFSDEHGDWPAGTYVLNPEGFRHAPFSREGCVIFVKLRQSPGLERQHVVVDTGARAWRPGGPLVERMPLYEQAGFADSVWLERWAPGAKLDRADPQGIEIFVIDGAFEDADAEHRRHAWLRLPPGFRKQARTRTGCTLYVKRGGFAYLRSAHSA